MPRIVRNSNGLAAYRRERGYTFGYISKRLGIVGSTLRRWETEGGQPTNVGYLALAAIYDVPVETLEAAAKETIIRGERNGREA